MIEQSDASPSAPAAELGAAPEQRVAQWLQRSVALVEHQIEHAGDGVWRALKTRPLIGVATAAALGLGAAMLIGASELVVAFSSGYAAYQILKKHEPPSKAFEEAAKIGL
jgi:hypothetical protein